MFQSHAGSIEALGSGTTAIAALKGFNPTLVRLRLLRVAGARAPLSGFQSHAGSIEANDDTDYVYTSTAFQSHAGSIEAIDEFLLKGGKYFVSIPRWFD